MLCQASGQASTGLFAGSISSFSAQKPVIWRARAHGKLSPPQMWQRLLVAFANLPRRNDPDTKPIQLPHSGLAPPAAGLPLAALPAPTLDTSSKGDFKALPRAGIWVRKATAFCLQHFSNRSVDQFSAGKRLPVGLHCQFEPAILMAKATSVEHRLSPLCDRGISQRKPGNLTLRLLRDSTQETDPRCTLSAEIR